MHLLHDRGALHELLARNPGLHLYALGDLDDRFWPRTTWYTDGDGEVALVYAAPSLAVLLAFTERRREMRALLGDLRPYLPRRFYAHLSPGLATALGPDYACELHGPYRRMMLTDPAAAARVDTSACEPVGVAQRAEALALYAEAYPGNWFDPWMLETGRYFAIRRSGKLVAIAGVHVVSAAYRVAALGNICVRPELRGQGLGAVVTARVCQALAADADRIGLNVADGNRAAIRCYERLGFTTAALYEEHMVRAC